MIKKFGIFIILLIGVVIFVLFYQSMRRNDSNIGYDLFFMVHDKTEDRIAIMGRKDQVIMDLFSIPSKGGDIIRRRGQTFFVYDQDPHSKPYALDIRGKKISTLIPQESNFLLSAQETIAAGVSEKPEGWDIIFYHFDKKQNRMAPAPSEAHGKDLELGIWSTDGDMIYIFVVPKDRIQCPQEYLKVSASSLEVKFLNVDRNECISHIEANGTVVTANRELLEKKTEKVYISPNNILEALYKVDEDNAVVIQSSHNQDLVTIFKDARWLQWIENKAYVVTLQEDNHQLIEWDGETNSQVILIDHLPSSNVELLE